MPSYPDQILAEPLAMFGQKLEAYEQSLLKGAAKTFASQNYSPGKIHLGAFRRQERCSFYGLYARAGCQVKTFLKPNCCLSSQIIFGHKFCAASATPAKVFLSSSSSSVGKKLLSTPPPPLRMRHASCAVPSVPPAASSL